MKGLRIQDRLVSDKTPPYIVAEVSANHGGDIGRAKQIIALAKSSGADAVKIQSYEPQTITLNSTQEDFLIQEGLWKGHSLYSLYSEAYTPFKWHKELFEYAHKIGIVLFSSPFDNSAVDLLEDLNAPAFKIASFELCDLPLIARAARTKKPLLMSTGLSSMSEIEEAVGTARDCGANDILLFHCISSYPAEAKDYCLNNIIMLRDKFDVLVGLSDHTIDHTSAVAATILGACAIEKHFIDSRKSKSADSSFSIEPRELQELKRVTSDAWMSIQQKGFSRPACEAQNKKFKRSIYFCKDLEAGEILDKDCIQIVRPGYGIPPKYYEQLIGKKLLESVKYGQRTSWSFFAKDE